MNRILYVLLVTTMFYHFGTARNVLAQGGVS
jgi:hypothetical protein